MNQDLSVAISMVMPAAIATGLFTKVSVSFMAPPTDLGDLGWPTGAYTPIAGLQDLPGMAAPNSVARLQGGTVKTIKYQEADNLSHVLIPGYYPAAEAAWRNGALVVISGVLYANNDVLVVECDSQQTQTRLLVRVVTI